jgi:RNA-directed DNA polymerase
MLETSERETCTKLRGGEGMETKLARIAEIAKERPKEKFTSLMHLINEEMLRECHKGLDSGKATGVDEQTKEEYGRDLEANIKGLIERMKRWQYRPQPVRRVYIPKAGSDKKRPLGIPAYEDKLVQLALSKILTPIYEADFLPCSFGYRPGRGCHDALKVLNIYLEKRRTNYVVDVDIRGFFDNVDHRWVIKFLEHRIKDPGVIRLVTRMLKAGIMEEAKVIETTQGTPQGGVISPLISNIYLHYVLDLWFYGVVRKACKGQAYMVRYADDFNCCFEYQEDAERFYEELKERLAKFNLEIAQEKSRILPFGKNTPKDGDKPGTFDFLGFTHYCSTSNKGKFRVKRKTAKTKYRAKLTEYNQWLKQNRNLPVKVLMSKLDEKLTGYYKYYCITDNGYAVDKLTDEIKRLLYKWLNRRSQRKSFNWAKFIKFMTLYPIPRGRVLVNIYELRTDISYFL